MNNNTITIDRDYFEHLLNCLVTQKYHQQATIDTFTQVADAMGKLQEENQRYIDEVQQKGRELLTNSLQEDMRKESESE